MKSSKGRWLIILGILLMGAALALTGYNLYTEQAAGAHASQVLTKLRRQAQEDAAAQPARPTEPTITACVPAATAIVPEQPGQGTETAQPETLQTVIFDSEITPAPTAMPQTADPLPTQETTIAPTADMPVEPAQATDAPAAQVSEPPAEPEEERELPPHRTIEVDGDAYMGVIEIPALELALPIIDEWSYDALKTAPCRYSGSMLTDNLVLLGHNYSTHFGRLNELKLGDEIILTDVDGTVHTYVVAQAQVLAPTQIEQMVASDYPLTLFTCTVGGRTRYTLRCEKQE